MNITITIEGISPLLIHAFTDAAQMAATDGNRSAAAAGSRGTPQEQADGVLYKGLSGDPIVPMPNVFACFIEGGKFFKAGKSKITTLRTSLIPACISIEQAEIPIVSKGGWSVDTRAVRIPATGGRILCHRPCFYDWQLTFVVDLDTKEMSPKLFRDIVDAAGSKIGLCSYRPQCKGPFGRFKVILWQEEKLPVLKKAA